jgi:glycolate oxidase
MLFFQKVRRMLWKLLGLLERGGCRLRLGGTGLSGAGIGKGIVIDFSKYLNKVSKIGETTVTQSGILLKKLNPKLRKAGYMLPSVPLQEECAIGGNINTDSIGPRTLRYGSVDNQVKSVRGVLADTRILDTENKILVDLEEKVLELRNKMLKEKALIKYLRGRPGVAGGYNLLALVDYKDVKDIITHLIVGSVGTLILLTEITLKLPKFKEFADVYLIHFSNLKDLQKSVNLLIKCGVTSMEYVEKETSSLWPKDFRCKGAEFSVIAAFENHKDIRRIVKGSLDVKSVSGKSRGRLWKARAMALPINEKRAKRMGLDLPPGIDDMSIKPKDFEFVRNEIWKYEKRSNTLISAFGHIGVGSIHLRPLINMKKHPEKLDKVGRDIFDILRKYGGTLVGEHNSGLCRSRYLEMESKKMYSYMKKVKDIFDPDDLLNPKTMFDLEPVTKNLGV